MPRRPSSENLDEETRRTARAHARRAAALDRRARKAAERVAEIDEERDAEWIAATELGMSRTEVAIVAGVHHSTVDRALNGR
jgi:hypothetical protein